MSNQVHQNLLAAIETLKTKGHTQADVVKLINRFCEQEGKKFRLSESTLSRLLRAEGKSSNKPEQILRILAEMQEKEEAFRDLPKREDLSHLLGYYAVYHKTTHGSNILCNILEIKADGTAIMHTESKNTHLGEVQLFQHAMVAINFREVDQRPFFYQLLFNLKGYLHYGLDRVEYFWGISTTISLEEFPMANIRLFYPLGQSTAAKPCNIKFDSDAFRELLAQKPALAIFNTDTKTRLLCPYGVNEMPEIS